MRRIAIGTVSLWLASALPAHGQTMVYWPAPITASQAAGMSYFPLGTPLKLVTRTEVSTKENQPGDRFYLEVAESLSYRGQVVVPAGSIAVGEVADLQRNGHFGRKGKLGIQLLYVQTPSGPVKLSGRGYDEGTSGTVASIATMALTPIVIAWAGMFVHGTSAHLPSGTAVNGYLAEDLRFTVRPFAAQIAIKQVAPDAAGPDVHGRQLPATFLEAVRARGVQTAKR